MLRRVLATAGLTTALLVVAACGSDPVAAPLPQPLTPSSPTTGAPPTPKVTAAAVVTPGDPAATQQACTAAAADATDVTKVFNDQLAAIEAAAAKGDENAMVAAAGVIQAKFVALSASLTTLSQQPLDSDVKAALSSAAAGLKEVSSESYPGTTQDTQKRLTDLAAAVAAACS